MKFTCLITRIILFALLVETLACGVKGPPLPPLETTPQASEVERPLKNARQSRPAEDSADLDSPSDALTDTEGTLTQDPALPKSKKSKKTR